MKACLALCSSVPVHKCDGVYLTDCTRNDIVKFRIFHFMINWKKKKKIKCKLFKGRKRKEDRHWE